MAVFLTQKLIKTGHKRLDADESTHFSAQTLVFGASCVCFIVAGFVFFVADNIIALLVVSIFFLCISLCCGCSLTIETIVDLLRPKKHGDFVAVTGDTELGLIASAHTQAPE